VGRHRALLLSDENNLASLVHLDEALSGAGGGRRSQGYGARTRISKLPILKWSLCRFSKGASPKFKRDQRGWKGASTAPWYESESERRWVRFRSALQCASPL
jgi:hypothetical protein